MVQYFSLTTNQRKVLFSEAIRAAVAARRIEYTPRNTTDEGRPQKSMKEGNLYQLSESVRKHPGQLVILSIKHEYIYSNLIPKRGWRHTYFRRHFPVSHDRYPYHLVFGQYVWCVASSSSSFPASRQCRRLYAQQRPKKQRRCLTAGKPNRVLESPIASRVSNYS